MSDGTTPPTIGKRITETNFAVFTTEEPAAVDEELVTFSDACSQKQTRTSVVDDVRLWFSACSSVVATHVRWEPPFHFARESNAKRCVQDVAVKQPSNRHIPRWPSMIRRTNKVLPKVASAWMICADP